jgi:hypothetical protein
MAFNTEYGNTCISSFSTPVRAYAPISGDGVDSGVFEYTSFTDVSWTVVSSMTKIMSGLAFADPVILGWQIHDIDAFLKEYVESLVDRFSIDTPISTPTATPNAPEPISPPRSEGLSTSTQVGIRVGVALGAAVVGGLIIF